MGVPDHPERAQRRSRHRSKCHCECGSGARVSCHVSLPQHGVLGPGYRVQTSRAISVVVREGGGGGQRCWACNGELSTRLVSCETLLYPRISCFPFVFSVLCLSLYLFICGLLPLPPREWGCTTNARAGGGTGCVFLASNVNPFLSCSAGGAVRKEQLIDHLAIGCHHRLLLSD